jgi:large subunit ribosomal protein L25
MQKVELEVAPRTEETVAHKSVNQLRREGLIPGVLYGHGDPVKIIVDAKTFHKATHGGAGTNALYTVKLGSQKDLSVIKEVQRDIITRKPIHIDFQRINIKEKLEMTIPVHTHGEAPGVKVSQGILQHIQREIRIKCLPDDIPGSIDIDISKLELHHSIKVQDITPPKGVEFVTAGDHIIVTIVAPKVEEETPKPGAELAAGAPAQPEVIAKGKKDEEGAAAAGAAPAKGAAAAAPAAEGDKKKK